MPFPLLPLPCWLLYFAITHAATTAPVDDFVVAGYLPDYRGHIDLVAAEEHLTDVMLFSIQPEPDGQVSGSDVCCLSEERFANGRAARGMTAVTGRKTQLRIFASIGGAGRSQHFASIASDPERRKALIANLIQLCQTELLDGVDFDWEQPQSQDEFVSYLHLLVEAGQALLRAQLLLSVALHPNQRLTPQLYDIVDRIHLMTYDMITSTGPGSHHATLDNAKRAVDVLVASGCPHSKIVLGIPAYARHEDNPGLVKTYSEIVDAVVDTMDSEMASAEEIATTMKRIGGRYQGYTFDSALDVLNKVQYAKETGLKGIFFWEIGQDSFREDYIPGGALLAVAHRGAFDRKEEANKKGGDGRDKIAAHEVDLASDQGGTQNGRTRMLASVRLYVKPRDVFNK
jgi:chitinase